MNIQSIVIFGTLAMGSSVYSDQEAPNMPYVVAAEWGRCYAKSVPTSRYGNDGETKVYDVERGDDKLIATYKWFSNRVYLNCGLGKGKKWGLSIVELGSWPRGENPTDENLAIAFYLSDSLLNKYSTLDIAGSKENCSRSVSHYEVIKEVLGYRWIQGNEYVFEIKTYDGKLLTFEPTTGTLLSRR